MPAILAKKHILEGTDQKTCPAEMTFKLSFSRMTKIGEGTAKERADTRTLGGLRINASSRRKVHLPAILNVQIREPPL